MKVWKRIALVMCMVVASIGAVPLVAEAAVDVEIFLNGKALEQDSEIGFATIKEGRTFVPLRLVVESLGFTADWQLDGPGVITMQGQGKTVYHLVGSLQASSNNPLLPSGVNVIATTDVPSYVDKVTGRTMVGLKLIGDAFGVSVTWERNAAGGGQVIMTMAGIAGSAEDVVRLDDNTSVLRSQVINRLSQQKVTNQRPGANGAKRTIAEQNKDWDVDYKNEGFKMVAPAALVERGTGFMTALYNVDYRGNVETWVENLMPYLTHMQAPRYAPPGGIEATREKGREWFTNVQNQQIIMESVFVTDELLAYQVESREACSNNVGEDISKTATPWAVRGTLFYKFDSIQHFDGSRFWTPAGQQLGEWYFIDVEVRFMLDKVVPRDIVQVIAWTNWCFFYDVNGEVTTPPRVAQPLSSLPQ